MPAGPAPRSTIEPGGVIPGTRYRALRPLGRGSSGARYEVEHLELGRRFVLTVLRADLSLRRELVQRARVDWQALGKLRHPNIAQVTDAGVTQHGLPYVVTEQLNGETLRQRLARRRRVTVPEALAIARDIALALAAAHAIGVVHRNVRPDTVFLPAHGRAKLLDFGVAKLDDDASLEADSNAVPERPRYRAPEQARGLTLDCRSDLYGVGLVLFEMVAGRAVFPGLERSRRATGLRPLAEVVPGVARALSDLVARLLAQEPERRPTSAEAVVRELLRLETRYEGQVSTTQATAHYTTARLPFLVDTASVVSEIAVIVPMPSQTLEGIPWTVADAVEAPTPEAPKPEAPEPESQLSMRPGAGLALCPTPPSALQAPGGASAPAATAAPPRSAVARGRIGMRLMLVMCCSLLGGVLVASLARRGIAGEVDAPETERLGVPERLTSKPLPRPAASFAPKRTVCPVLRTESAGPLRPRGRTLATEMPASGP